MKGSDGLLCSLCLENPEVLSSSGKREKVCSRAGLKEVERRTVKMTELCI